MPRVWLKHRCPTIVLLCLVCLTQPGCLGGGYGGRQPVKVGFTADQMIDSVYAVDWNLWASDLSEKLKGATAKEVRGALRSHSAVHLLGAVDPEETPEFRRLKPYRWALILIRGDAWRVMDIVAAEDRQYYLGL